jgi:hypothetical protein
VPYFPAMSYRMVGLEPPVRPPTGLGDLPTSAWSSKQISGVCIPLDASTLAIFKDLQRQTNRVLSRAGKALIGVDGRIGPGTKAGISTALSWLATQSLVGKALALVFPPSMIKTVACDWVAQHADQIAAKMREAADNLAAPVVADPASSKPSQPTSSGGVANPPPDVIASSASTSIMSWVPPIVGTPIGIAALVVGGLLIHKAYKSKGGRPGRVRAARRGLRRRRARARGRR